MYDIFVVLKLISYKKMMKIITTTIIVLVSVNFGFSQNTTTFFKMADCFFKEHVLDGKVNYEAIKEDSTKLNDALLIANDISVDKNNALEYQAFWINAYNLAVIKGVIDNYPLKSPLDKAGFFDEVTYNIGGKNITLNDIENKLLRVQFNDARFHFVLVCGAIGCPPLINTAYVPSTLDAQLEKQTKIALNGSFLKVDIKKKRVQGSEILNWYKSDFTMNGKSEIEFINQYRIEKIPNNFKLSYFRYNWNLNKQ